MLSKIAYSVVMLATVLSCGRRATQPAVEPAQSGQTIVLTDSLLQCGGSDTLRLGRLNEGETASARLLIRNDTQRPAVLLQHELTCGCIALSYDRRPFSPGETLSMQVDFDTRGLYGWQLKLFRILFSGADKPVRVYVEAEVEP